MKNIIAMELNELSNEHDIAHIYRIINLILEKDKKIIEILNDLYTYHKMTGTHSIRTGIIAGLIGAKIGLNNESLRDVIVAGFLHDIGKIDIPIGILDKPNELNDKEFDKIKKHPQLSLDIICNRVCIDDDIKRGICEHHEKIDGSGYPKGIKDNEISLYGKIIAVADVYDAITTRRSYRSKQSPEVALEYLLNNDNFFDRYISLTLYNIVINESEREQKRCWLIISQHLFALL